MLSKNLEQTNFSVSKQRQLQKISLLCNPGFKKCATMFPDMALGVCGRLVYIRVEFLHNPHESLLVVNIVQGRNHL